MAKRRKKKTKADLTTILVYLGIVFTGILFILKLFVSRIGWLDVFAPVVAAFLIIFLLTVIKTVVKKI